MAYAQTKNDTDPSINERTFAEQADSFFYQLVKLPEPEAKRIFKAFRPVVAKEIDLENLFFPQIQAVQNLLHAAENESIDVLTLFTLPVLQQKTNKAIVLDRETLEKLDLQYNLHGLFLISSQSADDDLIIQMDYLVAGQGKFIVGYDRSATIIHPDYYFVTGRYNYHRYFSMDVKTDDNGNRGLFDIKCISDPLEPFGNMRGPLNVAIKSLSLISGIENGKKISIKYELFGTSTKIIPCIPIEKLIGKNRGN